MMTSIGNKTILAKNLAYYVERSGRTQKEIAEVAGVAASTFNDWMKAKKYPRIDKIEILANYFGILKSDLIEEKMTEEKEKDNDIISDIIVRMRTDKKFLSVVESLYADAAFLAAVQSMQTLDAGKSKSIQDMLKAFSE